ncbi:MAG TPA: hypothetical protein VHV51_00565 [Polyangiaceae bacterium]|jgi:hypothetical protein|nr:hypothetical protein [Polyangiaceae bacterium]
MPIVLIELPAADAADVNAPALVAACSSGLRRGSCATEEQPTGERASAVAIVEWLDAAHLHARIDVGRRAEQRASWQTRELSFHEQDEIGERWRSVGLAIAGVVGEATLLEPPKPPPPAPTPAVPKARVRVATPSIARSFRVALGPALESGVSASKPALGGFFDFGWRPSRALPLELDATAAQAWSLTRSSSIDTRFATFGVGIGGMFRPAPSFELRASVFAALDSVTASATNPNTNARASGSRWLPAGLLRLQANWPARSVLSGVLGLEITRLSGATALKTFGQTQTESPATRGAAQLGVELEF